MLKCNNSWEQFETWNCRIPKSFVHSINEKQDIIKQLINTDIKPEIKSIMSKPKQLLIMRQLLRVPKKQRDVLKQIGNNWYMKKSKLDKSYSNKSNKFIEIDTTLNYTYMVGRLTSKSWCSSTSET